MSHSIEHVHDPLGWLVEAKRILKLADPDAGEDLVALAGA